MQKAKEEKCDEYKSIWLMAIILIVAFANYIVGYNWGLTSTFQPDESKLVEPLVSMVESKTLIHSAWAYPAQVSTKVLAIVLTWVSKFVILQHLQYYFANRIMYAFIGTGCVYITWRIIRKVRDERFALLMISLMAICPILAQYCKEVSGDVPSLFFSLLVLLFAQKYLVGDKKSLVFMAFFAACASLEKWHGAWTCFFIAMVVFANNRKSIISFVEHGSIALASFIGGIVLIAPNILTDFRELLSGVRFVYTYDGTKQNPLISAYPVFFFKHLGIVSVIVALIGICRALFYDKESSESDYKIKWAVYVFSPACLFAFWLIMTRTAFERWGLGVYWGILFFLTEGILFLIDNVRKPLKILGFVGLFLIGFCFCSDSLLVDLIAINSQKDGRIVGEQLMDVVGANIQNTISDFYTTLAPGGLRNGGESIPIEFEEYGINFATEKDGIPFMRVPGIKYVVIGGFYDNDGEGYRVVKQYGKEIACVDSSKRELDVFWRQNGSGEWSMFEGDTIRKNINDIKTVLTADVIGPSFTVYDVSNIEYLK